MQTQIVHSLQKEFDFEVSVAESSMQRGEPSAMKTPVYIWVLPMKSLHPQKKDLI